MENEREKTNGDGRGDVILGASGGDPAGHAIAGESYVVFGKADTAPVDLAAVAAGTGGFVIEGIDIADRSGTSVAGVGDTNGDGVPDVLIGAPGGDPGPGANAGESYVVIRENDILGIVQ